jgi:hypothetical protein
LEEKTKDRVGIVVFLILGLGFLFFTAWGSINNTECPENTKCPMVGGYYTHNSSGIYRYIVSEDGASHMESFTLCKDRPSYCGPPNVKTNTLAGTIAIISLALMGVALAYGFYDLIRGEK